MSIERSLLSCFVVSGAAVLMMIAGTSGAQPSNAAATAPATRPAHAHVMFVPQRFDDIAWENDKAAFRAYGPALKEHEGPSSGLDVWQKSTPNLVQADWYKLDDYHNDHGEGLDGYHVGKSRGCGGIAIFADGKKYIGENFTAYHILEDGPDRVVFTLDYAPIDVNGRKVNEQKKFTLESGTYFNRIESTFTFDGSPIDVGVGLKIKTKEGKVMGGTLIADGTDSRCIATWEPMDGKPEYGFAGAAVIMGADVTPKIVTFDGDQYEMVKVESGKPLVYLAGGGWSKGGFPTREDWLAHVKKTTTGFSAK